MFDILEKFNFWSRPPEALGLKRTKYLESLQSFESTESMVVITGARRSGKSTLAKQYIANLIERSVPPENILFLSFFIRKLDLFKKEENFFKAIEFWDSKTQHDHRKYIIIDEIQELESWDEIIASLIEDHTLNAKIVITGSNSKLLASEVTTKLSGRYYSLDVYPFSYMEFCDIRSLDRTSMESFKKFLHSPSSPEISKIDSEEARNNLIEGIVLSTVQKDIIERYNPPNPAMLSQIVEFTRLNSSNIFNLKSVANTLSCNRKKAESINPSTVEKYASYLQAVYFIHQCEVYSYRKKDILNRANRKFYLNDHGFALFNNGFEKGRVLENIIFLELIKHGFEVKTYLAYKNENLEIDFLATKKNRRLFVQVTWVLASKSESPSLWKREVENLQQVKETGEKIIVCMEPPQEFAGDIKILSPVEFIESLSTDV